MDKDFQNELKGFDAVWKRVAGKKCAAKPEEIPIMPGRKAKSKNVRFCPPRG